MKKVVSFVFMILFVSVVSCKMDEYGDEPIRWVFGGVLLAVVIERILNAGRSPVLKPTAESNGRVLTIYDLFQIDLKNIPDDSFDYLGEEDIGGATIVKKYRKIFDFKVYGIFDIVTVTMGVSAQFKNVNFKSNEPDHILSEDIGTLIYDLYRIYGVDDRGKRQATYKDMKAYGNPNAFHSWGRDWTSSKHKVGARFGREEDEIYLNLWDVEQPCCIMVFDCETTGLMQKNNPAYLIQLSWIVLDTEFNAIKKENYYIKPPIDIPASATAINHITNEMVNEKGMPVKTVLRRFHADRKLCKTLIAHNYKFDSEFIAFETARALLKEDMNQQYICTMEEGAAFCKLPGRYGDYKYPKLEELAERCGVAIPEGPHDSLVDCWVTAQCAKEITKNNALGGTSFLVKKHLSVTATGFKPVTG
ncbi:MAG: 3'-5' exonuclease [Tannerellaceae bacterium]|nr:3'-5' exonuclease [Tannerellaceae bacterium]